MHLQATHHKLCQQASTIRPHPYAIFRANKHRKSHQITKKKRSSVIKEAYFTKYSASLRAAQHRPVRLERCATLSINKPTWRHQIPHSCFALFDVSFYVLPDLDHLLIRRNLNKRQLTGLLFSSWFFLLCICICAKMPASAL